MRRRDILICLLGSAVFGEPLAAVAQQTNKLPRVGFLAMDTIVRPLVCLQRL